MEGKTLARIGAIVFVAFAMTATVIELMIPSNLSTRRSSISASRPRICCAIPGTIPMV